MFLSECQLREECSDQISVFTNQNLEVHDFKIPLNQNPVYKNLTSTTLSLFCYIAEICGSASLDALLNIF